MSFSVQKKSVIENQQNLFELPREVGSNNSILEKS
jgi:hypothetical protein